MDNLDNVITPEVEVINEDKSTNTTEVIETISEPITTEAIPNSTSEETLSVPTKQEVIKPDKENENLIFNKLKEIKQNDGRIEVDVIAKIRGGLRVTFEGLPLFLPTSHLSMKRNLNDDDLDAIVGNKIQATILDMQEDESGRRTVIVTRREILEQDFWNNIKVGDKITGKVLSTPDFGAFVDLGGVDGLVHVTKLSKTKGVKSSEIVKVGDEITTIVIHIDKENKKVSLTTEEAIHNEKAPSINLEEKFTVGQKIKGIVRRFTDFGAFVELAPGIDGLIRNQDISWTRRIMNANEVLKNGEELELIIQSINSDKKQISLTLKDPANNPWLDIHSRYELKAEFLGKVQSVAPAGAVVLINNEIDGFMPRSKMQSIVKGNKIPLTKGQEIEVIVDEIDAEKHKVILSLKSDLDFVPAERNEKGFKESREPRQDNRFKQEKVETISSSFSFADLLSASSLSNLNK